MSKRADLGKFLNELDKDDLILEIKKLHEKFEAVRIYYQIDITGDVSAFLAAAKKKIAGHFYGNGGKARRPKASRLNKIVRDFEGISIYQDDVIDLMLYRVEQTLAFININKYRNEPLEQSTVRAYRAACLLIADQKLESKFRIRCRETAEMPDDWDLKTAFHEVLQQYIV